MFDEEWVRLCGMLLWDHTDFGNESDVVRELIVHRQYHFNITHRYLLHENLQFSARYREATAYSVQKSARYGGQSRIACKKENAMSKLNFTVGPVQSDDIVRSIGAENVPYFRTPEFSAVMLENERLMLELSKAAEGSRAVFITGSGTASMEAAIMNTLTPADKAIVVNGGSFGQRFAQMLKIHDIPYSEIRLPQGKALAADALMEYEGRGYTAFLVNVHETSTGVLYDIKMIADFCRRNHIFLIVDAVSSFLADDFNMAELGAGVMITGSQKALACPPGISIMVLSAEAQERIRRNDPKCMYFDLKAALKDQERGQTPFTPAVGTLLQINARLKEIKADGGAEAEREKTAALAEYFREHIKDLPFEIVSESMSNAVTPLHPMTASAYDICTVLKDEYGIWVCPNGGDLRDSVFRVGHLGCLNRSDYDRLIAAFKDLNRRGLI